MRALVTGGSGFLGRHVCAALQALGADVHACGLRAERELAGPVPEKYVSCDLLNPDAVNELLRKLRPTHVLHLAWTMSPPQEYWNSATNIAWIKASAHLASAFARLGGRRFVGVGTCVEYADTSAPRKERETPTLPASLYGKAKLATCGILDALAQAHGFSAAWLRPFYLLGPGEAENRLVPAACRALEKREPFRAGNGGRVLDYLDARDAAEAMGRILLEESLTGAFNIASGKGLSVEALLLELADVCGASRDLIEAFSAPVEDGQCPVVVADVSRLREEAGFSPRRSLRQSLADCYADSLVRRRGQ